MADAQDSMFPFKFGKSKDASHKSPKTSKEDHLNSSEYPYSSGGLALFIWLFTLADIGKPPFRC